MYILIYLVILVHHMSIKLPLSMHYQYMYILKYLLICVHHMSIRLPLFMHYHYIYMRMVQLLVATLTSSQILCMIWLLFFCIQLRRHGTKHSSCFHFSVHHNHRSKQQAMTEIDKSFLDNVSIKVIFVKILSVCIPISPRLCEYLPP